MWLISRCGRQAAAVIIGLLWRALFCNSNARSKMTAHRGLSSHEKTVRYFAACFTHPHCHLWSRDRADSGDSGSHWGEFLTCGVLQYLRANFVAAGPAASACGV